MKINYIPIEELELAEAYVKAYYSLVDLFLEGLKKCSINVEKERSHETCFVNEDGYLTVNFSMYPYQVGMVVLPGEWRMVPKADGNKYN